jgi:hypothetical protein
MEDPRAGITVGAYDLLLVVIAVPLVAAWLATALWQVAPAVAAGVGSLTASGGIGYALFGMPPSNEKATSR